MTHLCHAEGCNVSVPPAMFMCKRHWFMVPSALRFKIWATYRPGQENDKQPSPAYMVVQCLAREAVARKEGRDEAAAECAIQATMWRDRAREDAGK